MSEANPDLNDSAEPYGEQGLTSFKDLDDDVQAQALAVAIKLLTSQGLEPFTSKRIAEALGPSQLRLIGENINLDQELNEETVIAIAENIPADTVEPALEKGMVSQTNSGESSPQDFPDLRQTGTLIATNLVLTLISISGIWLGFSMSSIPLIALSTFLLMLVGYNIFAWSRGGSRV